MADSRIPKPEVGEHDAYFSTYIDRVEEGDLIGDLRSQVGELTELCGDLSEAEGEFRYAPDKWSVKEVLGHL
ncbi:MAG: DinB family protein, partial [Thermoanaerobaculia bacterium]